MRISDWSSDVCSSDLLVAIDQSLLVQIDEHLDHRAGEVRVHGELFARPVHRAAETAELAGDLAATFTLPFPDLVDELFAGEVGALLLLLDQLALDHHLRRDDRMVHADDPQRILAAPAFVEERSEGSRVGKEWCRRWQ